MKKWLNFVILGLMAFFMVLCQQDQNLTKEEKLAGFFAKDKVRIIVTDSGLGGLSVAADVYERLKTNQVFKEAEVVFFNAQPHLNSGYNMMETTDQKVLVFNNALNAMNKEFRPDVILIACNTLSVLYDFTQFSRSSSIPVIGIVETGIDLIKNEMDARTESQVIIFATETTVGQGKHRAGLNAKGIADRRIFTQACPSLAGRIERGPDADTTKALVAKYVREILGEFPKNNKPLLVSYNCTHYGYVNNVFQKAFEEQGVKVEKFLDPNPLMADFMFEENYVNRYPGAKTTIRIVSQPELTPGKQAAIFGLIEPHSEDTANALLDYQFVPDFFEWESIAKTIPEE